jgi:hypothetical protein
MTNDNQAAVIGVRTLKAIDFGFQPSPDRTEE